MNNRYASQFASNLFFFSKSKNKLKPAILLLGAPGVGKSTQTNRIAVAMPGVMCVSTGNLLRKADAKIRAGHPLNKAEEALAKTNSLGNMAKGGLVDDDAVYGLLMAHLSPGGEGYEQYSQSEIIILDGVIKADRNITPFESALEKFNQLSTIPMNLIKVINIEASDTNLIARHQARVNESLNKGEPQRPDDSVETYMTRLANYKQSISPVIDHYAAKNNLIAIDSTDRNIDEITQALVTAITKTDIHANKKIEMKK